jgi:Peptidase family M48
MASRRARLAAPSFRWLCVSIALALLAISARAQQPCRLPPVPPAHAEENLFTPQQEVDLGDAVAAQVERTFRVVQDPQLTAHVRQVMARLLADQPATGLRFRVYLFDLPWLDAFSLPGGRIYISREMVAFLHNDDELAGLLGHEMGHILSHQGAIRISVLMHDVLRVTQVGDRADIFAKYNQLVDNAAKTRNSSERLAKHEVQEEFPADRIGLELAVEAGYSPQGLAGMFDRLSEAHGKTGGWLSDVFGLTSPNQKRLRKMRQAVEQLPAACRAPEPAQPGAEFQAWQAAVAASSGLAPRESLAGLIEKRALDPPLRGDLRRLRFSPDGRYLLAQDQATIYVLSRAPLVTLFRIYAPGAFPAQFTPDSASVVFTTPEWRVERWSVAEQRQTFARQLVLPRGCERSLLSPDGNAFACLASRGKLGETVLDLELVDVQTGKSFFVKKDYSQPSVTYSIWPGGAVVFYGLFGPQLVRMVFSPDGRYFLAAANEEGKTLAVDLLSRAPLALPHSIQNLLRGRFVFLDGDRLVAVNMSDPKKSQMLEFPSGKQLLEFPLGNFSIAGVTKGDYVLIHPYQIYAGRYHEQLDRMAKYGALLFSLKQGMVVTEFQQSPADLYGTTIALEQLNGNVALYDTAERRFVDSEALPVGMLGRTETNVISPNLDWLAISGATHGAIFHLTTGQRLYNLRGFWGAWFAPDGAAYLDFPKRKDSPAAIARADLKQKVVETELPLGDSFAFQAGRYLLTFQPGKKGGDLSRNVTLAAQGLPSGATLWSRHFAHDAPSLLWPLNGDSVVLGWSLEAHEARQVIGQNVQLAALYQEVKDRGSSYFLELVDPENGKTTGGVIVDTGGGSFRINHAFRAGDWVLVANSMNQMLVYSLSTGKLTRAFFGSHAAISPSAGLLLIANKLRELDVYQLGGFEKVAQLVFPTPVAMAQFSADGKRLLVLTAEQVAYFLNCAAVKAQGENAAANH